MDKGLEQMEKDVQEIKVQVELVKKDIQQFQKVVDKLDTTNDKIQELINNITTITTQHQQKIVDSETNSKYIWEEIADVKKQIASEKKTIEERLTDLEKSKWMLIGGVSFLTLLMNIVSTFVKSN
jgi:cell division septum initiation protein DivIVA